MTVSATRIHVPQVDILVCTPGRLQDHLTNTPGFAQRLSAVQTLILVRIQGRPEGICRDGPSLNHTS